MDDPATFFSGQSFRKLEKRIRDIFAEDKDRLFVVLPFHKDSKDKVTSFK